MTNLEYVSEWIIINDNAELLAHRLKYVGKDIIIRKNATFKANNLTTID
jgi:hypothetical protein